MLAPYLSTQGCCGIIFDLLYHNIIFKSLEPLPHVGEAGRNTLPHGVTGPPRRQLCWWRYPELRCNRAAGLRLVGREVVVVLLL